MRFTIDELEPEVVDATGRRAAAAGRSMEQELREVVSAAVEPPPAVSEEERRRKIEAWQERTLALRKRLWGGQVFEEGAGIFRTMRDERFGPDDPR